MHIIVTFSISLYSRSPDEQFRNKIMTFEYRDSGWDQSAAIYRISLRNKFYEKTNQIKLKKQKF